MSGRLLRAAAATAGLAAGLLLGPGLLVAPRPAYAASSNCVAVVVDSGSRVSGKCMTWRAGLTGAGALSGTGHSYGFARSGLVCSVDGFPADCHVDSTHYWSYWHKAPGSGSWTYSNEGAGTYNPRKGETEGWAYQNGSSRQPRNIPFTTICPPPKPAPAPLRPPAPRAHAGTGTAGGSHPAGAAAAGRSAAAALPSRSPGTSPSGNSPSVPAAALPASASARRYAERRSGSPGTPVQPILLTGLGLVAAAGLGTAAWRRMRKAG
jgi:hypothetical protein